MQPVPSFHRLWRDIDGQLVPNFLRLSECVRVQVVMQIAKARDSPNILFQKFRYTDFRLPRDFHGQESLERSRIMVSARCCACAIMGKLHSIVRRSTCQEQITVLTNSCLLLHTQLL